MTVAMSKRTSPLARSFIVVTLATSALACTKDPPHGNPPRPPEKPHYNPGGPPEPTVSLKAGDDTPALVATASNGTAIDLAAMKGKTVVVYFYPKDDTPGCTKEACAFRDAWKKLEDGQIVVIGVSEDSDESHKAFTEKYKLPLPLVADTDGSIAKRFGVPVENGHASRMSFLIGKDGKIKKVYPKVDPAIHCDEILTDAAS
jgi:thioredoxin-dependent peroxiredoxin